MLLVEMNSILLLILYRIFKMKKKELLFSITKKDFEIQTFRSGGKGGQNQNKVESGVRIIHKASGAVGESREERHQLQNKKKAFKRLTETEKFKNWLLTETSLIAYGKDKMTRELDELLSEKNLVIEYFDPEDKKWKKQS